MNPEQYLEAIEAANASGKLRRGVNEVTKALERGTAKLVVAATDVSPKELIMHLPLLAKEKGIAYGEVASKEELGAAAGLQRPTASVAILDAGSGKDILKQIEKDGKVAAAKETEATVKGEAKEEAKEDKESKDNKKEEPKKENTDKEDSAAEEKEEKDDSKEDAEEKE